jgi:hypothetical protein
VAAPKQPAKNERQLNSLILLHQGQLYVLKEAPGNGQVSSAAAAAAVDVKYHQAITAVASALPPSTLDGVTMELLALTR